LSRYQQLAKLGKKYIGQHKLFKHGFNLSPMYRRSTGRIIHVSKDLMKVDIKLPLSWKNSNYVNTIFGGSMFAAVDPIPMVQLINILGDKYVVWDKSAQIRFKRPAKTTLYASFQYDSEEVEHIKKKVSDEGEIEIVKRTVLTNKEGNKAYCIVDKTIYVADKLFYKEKRKLKAQQER